MNIYTAILNGKELNQVLNLPKEYVSAELEVKVKVLKKTPVKKMSKFDTFFGVMKLDNLDEEIQSLRDNWKQL